MSQQTIHRPLATTAIHAVLSVAMSQGASAAIDSERIRAAAPGALTLRAAVPDPDYEFIRAVADGLAAYLIERAGAGGTEEARSVIRACVDAAWVIGAADAAVVLPIPEGEMSRRSDAAIHRLMLQVVPMLVELGVEIQGSEELLADPEPICGIFRVNRDNGEQEIRTTWIQNSREPRAYQWRVRTEREAFIIDRRYRGNRAFELDYSLHPDDVPVLSAMLDHLPNSGSPTTKPGHTPTIRISP